ncbi:hypothetical protein SRABI83_01362 [Arthrobacter sp. Bi83]|nr:hypothetical protein SRABI83_01362 [Arthrobacter sp. Bi83]
MSRQGGAADPDGLARKLALLLEGAQALGMPPLHTGYPRLAHAAARQLIQEALPLAPNKAPAPTKLR